MTCKVIVSSIFRKEAKRLIKKFPSLKNELNELAGSLQENPVQGSSLGNNSFKIRLAVKSKGKGKSGGMRIITWVVLWVSGDEKETWVNLVTIYDKSEKENITDNRLKEMILEIKSELHL